MEENQIYLNHCALYLILFHYGLLQNTERSSLRCTVGLCWLSALYTVVVVCKC